MSLSIGKVTGIRISAKMTSRCLSGKVAIITGAGSGIGRCTAVHFAKLGSKLVITDLNAAGLNEAKKHCIKACATAEKVVPVVGDITDAKVQKSLVQTASDRFGALDILVNCAGIAISHKITEDSGSIDTFDQTFNVNVRSTVELCRLSVEHLIKSKGNIVNISSIGSMRPLENAGYYSMSKAAVDMLTQVLAQELAPKGVRVNSVHPGGVDTPMFRSIFESKGIECTPEKLNNLMTSMHALDRGGKPQDIANAIAFLASDQASWITGTNLKVDGGCMIKAGQLIPKQLS